MTPNPISDSQAAIAVSGVSAIMTIPAFTNRAVFAAFVREVLVPTLRPGQIVVLDNLRLRTSTRKWRTPSGLPDADCSFCPTTVRNTTRLSPAGASSRTISAVGAHVPWRACTKQWVRHCRRSLLRMPAAGSLTAATPSLQVVKAVAGRRREHLRGRRYAADDQ